MRLIRFFLCGCLLCAAPIPDVFAQPAASPPAASSAMTDKARDLYSEGVQLFRQKKWPQAEASFEAAWALAKHYSIAANLGETRLRLAKYRAAAELLAFAYRQAPATETPERKHLAGLLAEAKGKVGTVVVKTNVPGASVTVGGKAAGETPLADPIYVEPGSVTIRVYCDGYASQEKTLDLKAGQEVALDMTLERPAAPIATVTASPTAAVPAAPSPTPTPPPRSKVPAFVLGGVGVASLLAGGVMLGLGFSQKADVETKMPRDTKGQPLCFRSAATGPELHPECPALRETLASGQTTANASVPILIVGGAAVAGAAAYLLWPVPKTPPSKPASRFVPVANAEGAGVVWMGSF